MRIIWQTKEIEISLWGTVAGLKHKGQRPDAIYLSLEEKEELERAGERGAAYRKRLKQALPFGKELS